MSEHSRQGAVITAHRMGIDTYQEPVVFMRADCHVCRSEGFQVQARVKVSAGSRSLIATLNVVSEGFIAIDKQDFLRSLGGN